MPNVLLIAVERMNPAEREMVVNRFDHYERGLKKLNRQHNGPSVAFSIHEHLDEATSKMLAYRARKGDEPVSCRPGCAHCCYLHVDVTPQEAELMIAFAIEQEVTIDFGRLTRQGEKTADTWGELSPEDRRCVFLGDDRKCAVYEHRPGGCRKYFVATDPDLCDSIKHPKGNVGVVFDLEAEVSYAAALEAFGADTMARMIQRKWGLE